MLAAASSPGSPDLAALQRGVRGRKGGQPLFAAFHCVVAVAAQTLSSEALFVTLGRISEG